MTISPTSVVGAYGPLFSAMKFGEAYKGLTLRINPKFPLVEAG